MPSKPKGEQLRAIYLRDSELELLRDLVEDCVHDCRFMLDAEESADAKRVLERLQRAAGKEGDDD